MIIFELGRLARFGEPEMCSEEIICVLDEAAELGVRHIVLEADGPLRADDLVRLAASAARRVSHLSLVLGRDFAVDASFASELDDAGVCDVALPFEVLGSLDAAPRVAIDTLRDEGLGVRAIVPGWPGFVDVKDVARRLAAIGVTRLQVNVTCGSTRCPLTARMLGRMARAIVDVARTGTLAMIVTELPLVRRIDIEESHAPVAGSSTTPFAPLELDDSRTTMRIGPTGDVMPSRALPLVAGNVRRQRLEGIWSVSGLYPRLRDRERLVGRCSECAWREHCGGSRARAWNAEGDYHAADPACSLPVTSAADAAHRATA
ncbi:MAG: SPASM domain-containing protein [Thermoanaerobaculia bacterium]